MLKINLNLKLKLVCSWCCCKSQLCFSPFILIHDNSVANTNYYKGPRLPVFPSHSASHSINGPNITYSAVRVNPPKYNQCDHCGLVERMRLQIETTYYTLYICITRLHSIRLALLLVNLFSDSIKVILDVQKSLHASFGRSHKLAFY